jgi:hypothetical protein
VGFCDNRIKRLEKTRLPQRLSRKMRLSDANVGFYKIEKRLGINSIISKTAQDICDYVSCEILR